MIRQVDPEEPVRINGVQVTGWMLAEARQELSHRGVHNPRWDELSTHDREMAALSASNWLRALTEVVAEATSPARLAELDRADPLNHCGRCNKYVPLDKAVAVPTVLWERPDGGAAYKRWHPDCRDATKRERQSSR